MNLLPLTSIKISPTRQRREFDEGSLQELAASIRDTAHGLLHPPIVRFVGPDAVLVAGERRLRAIADIYELGGSFRCDSVEVPAGMVPVTGLGELEPLEAEEAELEENIQRVDLSWQERAEAEARLVRLRAKQAAAAEKLAPLLPEVAAEAGVHPGTLSRDLLLARNMHRPEVKLAKSAPEAMKALLRVEEAEKNREKATALGKDFLGGKHRLFNWSCLDWMAQQPEGEFDVICTDPPYGMGADEFGDSGGATAGAHEYDDDTGRFYALLSLAAASITKVAKANAHLYLFCDFDKFHWLKELFESRGWRVHRTPIIWYKPASFRCPWANPPQGPQRKYETILYAVRGEMLVTKLAGDLVTYAPDGNLGHQAQKPVDLFRDLLSRSVRPGMKVLDPFCGTGTIFPAAHALSAIATGIELDPGFFAIAAGRLGKIKGEGK